MSENIEPVKDFLNKRMVETTIGDQMVMHAVMVVSTLAITATIQILGITLIKMANR